MRTILMLGIAAAMLASPAFADPAATPPPQQLTPVADKNTMECHYLYHEGTIMRHQTCMRSIEWQFLRMQQQRILSEMSSREFQKY